VALYASRMGVSDSRETQYAINGAEGLLETLYLDPANNVAAQIVSSAIGPTASGEIVIDIQKGPGNTNGYGFYYLGTLVLRTLGNPAATGPTPADGAMDVTSPLLAWSPGDTAASHDVYLGTTPALTAADLVSEGQATPVYWHTAGLELGTTYYWRVDEVAADMTTVHTGSVWTFSTALDVAHAPAPADGAAFIGLEQPELAWTAGWGSVSHDVYFGTDADTVANGTGDTFKGNQTETTFLLGTLESGLTYYWRVDEIAADGAVTVGLVWSFATVPQVAIGDPDLVGWWKFDEGTGTSVVDWSGHGHHGTLSGTPQWVAGLFGGALDLEYDNAADGVAIPGIDVDAAGISLTAWLKPESFSQHDARIIDKGIDVTSSDHAWWMMSTNSTGGNIILRFRLKTDASDTTTTQFASAGGLAIGEWAHAAAIWNGSSMILYQDGVEVGREDKAGDAVAVNPDASMYIGNQLASPDSSGRRPWDGLIDDVRVYSKGLTVDELKDVMRGDPLPAWDPSPYNGVLVDAVQAAMLTWQPGDEATAHNVYLGTDRAAVQEADASDTSGIYRGSQSTADYTPDPALEWDQEYFWRVDEINGDGTISVGYVWSFTVAGYLIVDEFESYNDDDNFIYEAWIDGWVNESGSTVGYLEAPFAEQTIVNGGRQSMPLFYDNAGVGYAEAERTFDTPQDWTGNGLNTLLLYVHGRNSSGSVDLDSTTGTYTMVGAGSNVWGTSDEFHFAPKELRGNGSITVRVDSIMDNPPHGDPRIGVMMRNTLDPDSANATLFVEPDPRTRLTARLIAGSDTAAVAEVSEGTVPTWIRLTREGFIFRAERSDDGVNFIPLVDGASEATISMVDPVYVGLVVCSHASGQFIEATLSNVTTEGNITAVGAFTTSQDVGIASNSPQPMYVGLEDSAGQLAFVTDGDLVVTNEWMPLAIPFSEFVGVNPAAITKMIIGIGDRDNPTLDGSGLVYLDDIRLIRPPSVDPGPDGLLAHYTFEGSLEDSSGNALDGTAAGDPVYGQGPAGQGSAMDFDGIDDVVELGQLDVVGGGMTLTAWIKPDTFAISDARIISKATEWAGDSHFWMMSTQAETQLRFRLKTDEGPTIATLVSPDPVLEAGVWMHVAATWDGATMRIYRDGVEVGSMAKGGSAVAVDPTVSAAIGSQPSDAFDTDPSHVAKFFDGLIDEVRIYNRALSETEVRYLAGD
jgi:concanavalin A-like lectin/glucanase superfamily protein